jgi:FkbM family methyltransferase
MSLTPVSFHYDGKPFTIVVPSATEHIGREIARLGTFYERDVLEACREALREVTQPFTIVDVGAFCGNHTTYFARCCGAAEVIACEPSPDTVSALRATIQANALSTVTVLPIRLGETDRFASVESLDPANTGSNQLRPASEGITIQPGDAVLRRAKHRVGLIEIDVEGEEANVKRHRRAPWRVSEILCVGHSMRGLYAPQSETGEARR